MSDYNTNALVKLNGLKMLAQRVNERLEYLEGDTTAIRRVEVDGNTVKFFNTTDATVTTPVYNFDFPEEIFLDQAGTTLVNEFEFSAETYPGATNPNLDGKTVLVLAVKGDKETNPTTKYSFVNMEKLIDIYTASDTSIAISDYKVQVKISAAANNSITLQNDGLHVDVSGKVDKVSGATEGNVALFNSEGGIANSTIIGANILTKVSGATKNNLVVFESDGSIIDSTYGVATDEAVTAMLDEVLPTVEGGEGE